MWSVRQRKNRDKVGAVRRDSTREVADVRTQTPGLAAEPAKRDDSRVAASVMVVGPPGCCGCVSESAGSRSRRKR